LHKELTSLADAGVLVKEPIGNQVEYSANRDCPIFEELASILRKTSGIVDVLADALILISKKIAVAFVFGSVARGKETAGSDIDVLVVGEITFTEVVKALYPVQEILGREINPKVYSKKEWKKMLRSEDAFIKEVMANDKLFIVGGANELE